MAPVSTTHAVVRSLVGAGLMLAPGAVQWQRVAQKVALPLLLSIGVADTISALLPPRSTASVGTGLGSRVR
jgi:inorganic phosphate transporter, PiT family